MPGAGSRTFQQAVRDGLVARTASGWQRFTPHPGGPCKLRIDVEGTQESETCFIEVVVRSGESWPHGSISVIWNGERVFGLDLDGPAHRNRNGIPIPTPHLQQLDENGTEDVVPVDVRQEAIDNLETAIRWLARQAGIAWEVEALQNLLL